MEMKNTPSQVCCWRVARGFPCHPPFRQYCCRVVAASLHAARVFSGLEAQSEVLFLEFGAELGHEHIDECIGDFAVVIQKNDPREAQEVALFTSLADDFLVVVLAEVVVTEEVITVWLSDESDDHLVPFVFEMLSENLFDVLVTLVGVVVLFQFIEERSDVSVVRDGSVASDGDEHAESLENESIVRAVHPVDISRLAVGFQITVADDAIFCVEDVDAMEFGEHVVGVHRVLQRAKLCELRLHLCLPALFVGEPNEHVGDQVDQSVVTLDRQL